MKRRVLSFITTLALCLNLCPTWAFAAAVDEALCPHHQEHTAECGYVPDTPDAPCTYVCRICPIEDLISELPDSVSADNAGQVGEQLGEIYDLFDALTDEEQAQVDLSPCAALMDQIEGLDAEVLDGDLIDELTGDFKQQKAPRVVTSSVILKTNGYSLININTNAGSDSTTIQVKEGGDLKIVGGGTIRSEQGIGIEVQSGGSLTIAEPGITIKGKTYALSVASGATIRLSAGRYESSYEQFPINIEGDAPNDYAAVLASGYAFFDAEGNALSLSDLATAHVVTVGKCEDHVKGNYAPKAGTPKHTWTCANCGMTETEPCTFTFDENGTGTCDICYNEITVTVDRESLKALAYDNTVKPANGTVTVTVKDASAALTPDTDYTVDYKTRAQAGSTDITVTVTVTGKAFNGTFTHDYTFTEAELTEPVLKWNSTDDVTVPYTGSPVEKTQLPEVTINISTSSGVDLHDQLQYSYKEQGDTAYTTGLPTNAGTYDVVVTLPEGTDYQAASSEPITLIVEPINPITTAPVATTPTYNRNPQALVTAGELDPVAVADGLKIQFATEQNGAYSDTIPTETNAGEYHVWYQVTGLTDNYTAPDPNPAEITGVEILRKAITPVVTLSDYTYLYDGGDKEPTVTVKDDDRVTDLPDTEYKVEYVNNRNVSTDANPAKVVVTDSDPNGGNYTLEKVEVPFKITRKIQDTLSITQKPNTVIYGDEFTLSTSGGSGDGLVTWKITTGKDTVATVDANSGQVTITGDGSVTVKATKSGEDPATGVVNYEDATATWTFTADKKPVTAVVTADDKTYDGNTTATVAATLQSGDFVGADRFTITLAGAFADVNAGEDKTVTVNSSSPDFTVTGGDTDCYVHYNITYPTTVKATIHKAIAKITTPPVAANLTYNGTAQALIDTTVVEVDPADAGIPVEYALDKNGPYSTDPPEGTNAGDYTVWYRVKETNNYTGLAPASVDVTIGKKPVSPTIELSGDGLQTDSTTTPPTYSYVYDGTAKEPTVTLYEADGTTVIPDTEYTVAYSDNINVTTDDQKATVTVTAKDDGNYTFDNAPVTATFTISQKQAQVLTAPEPAGRPLTFANYAQRLVTAGTGSGGTMVYCVDNENGTYESAIPERKDAGTYTVYYKVQGDTNHSDSDVGQVEVTIAPKVVTQLAIELFEDDGTTPLVSYTYDGTAKKPKVVVKDGSTEIDATEYTVVYSDNTDAGRATVSINDNTGGNYTVTGSANFVIQKANIEFDLAPAAADLTYNGTAQELLTQGKTTGGTIYYALGTSTSEYHDYIPTGTNAGDYTVYYKVTGDKNHNDFPITEVDVTIERKPLSAPTIELTPNSFKYDGDSHLPTVTVKDGDTVLPTSEYTWVCSVTEPKDSGTYTITIDDAANGNYDLSGVTAPNNSATFSIGKAAQDELVITGLPDEVHYGDTIHLSTSGGSGNGAVTWNAVGGNATTSADGSGTITITGVGEVHVTVVKKESDNYQQVSTNLTFTAARKPVTATVTVADKVYDGTTAATVASADINADLVTIDGATDTVTIDPASITAAFADPHAGTDKTVTLDTSKVVVTGDTAKYTISYPETVTANITQATTTITTDPAKIDPLTYSGQPQALVTAGVTNVGFLVYSLDGTSFSSEIPTGTDAGTYTVYYKVDGTADYTGVAVNPTPISVTIGPKDIQSTVKIELSGNSFRYDGTKKDPKVTVKDGDTVLSKDQDYTIAWAGTKSQTEADMLRIVDTYTVTVSKIEGKNYTFTPVTATVEITPAEQAGITITGNPEHVYYGDTITTLGTTGGTGEGTVAWKITAGEGIASIDANGVLTITGVGAVTVRAERSVPNYGTVGDNWNFTVEPKPVTAEVTVASKTYDGTTATGAITAQVKTSDLVTVNGITDTVTITGLTGVYTDPNAGTGKTVTLDSTNATATSPDKYTVSYPAIATGDITPKPLTLTAANIALSGNDLQGNTTDGYYYNYDGTDKTPAVTVTADDGATLADSDYSVSYADNKNVGTADVTVTAKAEGNYTFTAKTVTFEIRSAAAELTTSPQAKNLTYEKGTEQELVTVGVATGGTVVYKLSTAADSDPSAETGYGTAIPKAENAGTYTVFYKVKGDANHNDTAPGQVSVTIKPKEITPTITLSDTTYTYDGNAKTPTVTVKDGDTEIDGPDTDKPEYSVSYRDNVNAGTATVTVSNANGGNYIVNGTATFEITKAAPTVTPPTAITGLQYTGELQDLVSAGVCHEGTVLYSVNGGNYTPTVPTASAVGEYEISYMVQGDANHSDTAPVTLTDVVIAKNTVNNPTIQLSTSSFRYDGSEHRPTVAVYDGNSRLIPEHEYTATITGGNLVDVGTYTVTIAATANSNYVFEGTLTRTFEITKADQETISITGAPAQVTYGDEIQLGVSGGTGTGTITWRVTDKDGNEVTNAISATGRLTVKHVGGPYTVTVTRSRGGNYTDVSATWEFTAAKKPVTAEVTVAPKNWDGNTDVPNGNITATVKAADLVTGDSITITGLTGAYDNADVGTGKTVTLGKTNVEITGTNADKYDVTIPATATASILAVAAEVTDEPKAVTPALVYDAAQSQELVTAGTATGGTMVYSLDGTNFTAAIPKAKDAGTYTVHFKAQGDQNHTDSAVGTKEVTIGRQTVTPQIELSPPSGQYDGKVQQPDVTVRDAANNVIPTSEYKVTYVADGGANWKDKGTYTVKVEDITGGNYIVAEKDATFTISTSAQAPLEIVNKPGLVYYGDTFTLSATGGSASGTVQWSSSDLAIADIDANGFVTIKGTGSATITAKKAGGTNYDEVTATYPLNALKKPVTAIVTADDREYVSGDKSAVVHITWRDGDLINGDTIQFNPAPTGEFDSDAVGTGKQVTVTANVVSDATAQKYAITIPATTTASIYKADKTAPAVSGNTLTYNRTPQVLVTGGDANTLYSTSRDGAYSTTVPTGTNAGDYTVWYKEKGDANHNDSEPQFCMVTISPKELTSPTIELSGNDLKTENGTHYYEYDGTDKTPTVTVKDGTATVPSSEYTVSYLDNKNATTADKKATVTITDNEGGNYTVSGSTTFEIRKVAAVLTGAPQDRNLTYNGAAQPLVTVGTATGGHIEYKLHEDADYGTDIPTGTDAKTYTVDYKLVGEGSYSDGPSGSVTVTIQPKTVVSPKITVSGTYTYDGTEQKPAGTAVTVEDGDIVIDAGEYTLSYQNNVNAGTATVFVADNNGGNFTVNGSATFEIGKAVATVGTAPTGKTGLHYTGATQELITAGSSNDGTVVYSLNETGEYSAAIPTGKAVGEYEIWYKVLGDGNHSDSAATALSPKVKIETNTVTNPTIQVTPGSVKYTGEKQTPTVTVKDNAGLLIDGSEYTVTYADTANSNNSDLIQVGTYTVTVTGKDTNYSFSKTATFKITPADQTALTITGTRDQVCYGDTIPLGTTGGTDGGTVTWKVSDGAPATIDASTGQLKITGVGSVTVTATSTKTGYADQIATWNLYADKKPVTALVTAKTKTYDGNAEATVTATLQTSDFVGTDRFTVTLTGSTFEDVNAGTDKKVNVVSTSPSFTVTAGGTNCYDNYAITYPATATASISKADVTGVTPPTLASGLTYTGLPQALITAAGSATGGTMEYSLDGETYTANLNATDAGAYDVWYRVRGDGNHNDTTPVKMGSQVTIAPQSVNNPTIAFNPNGATYDGQEHRPTVTLKDANNRVIPSTEYTVDYGTTDDWKTVGDHTVTIEDKTGGNYIITGTLTKDFTILPAGQSPLSIVGQPGEVQYGGVFTLSTNGGSGTGAVSWESSDPTIAFVNSATGRVEILKAGPATITARKAAGGGYGETTATWTFSAEKKPVTPVVTARNKPYDGNTTATLDVSWNPGDLLGNDTITLNLTGAFDDSNVGENKIVRITGTAPASDKYAVAIPNTTTASITATAATVSGVNSGPWEYSGSGIALLQGGAATNGTIVYSRNGVDFMETSPMETNAGTYRVYYKARGNTNYADSEVRMVEVTIQPKTVTNPVIDLASDSVTYDGTAQEPEVVRVLDSTTPIPASEYTVSYSSNVNVGTGKVTITDAPGGNYTVSGSRTFTITAGEPTLVEEPQPNNRTYDGSTQPLVTAGSAVNGRVVYSLDQNGTYSRTIPMKADADTYTVWYKVQGENGAADTTENYVMVTISPKPVTPTILLNNQNTYSTPYTGSAITPAVTVIVDGQVLALGSYLATPSNNTKPGTATIMVQSTGGNYQFYVPVTFEITKGKAAFMSGGEPKAKTDLAYTGEPLELVEAGYAEDENSVVVYSLDRTTYSPEIPTAVNRGTYTVFAKVQGNEFYEDSAVTMCRVTIDVNALSASDLTVTLPTTNYPYTGSEVKPTVTVSATDIGVIPADEYTVTYSGNVEIGTATINIKSKTNGNYSFTASTTFNIVDASQTPLTITGKKDTVYYGDTLQLTASGGGNGAVTWSSNNTAVADIDANGTIQKIKTSGSVTITATKGTATDTWTFYAQPKPVTATVTAANKVYDGNTNATLAVTLNGLVSGETVSGVNAQGEFMDANVGTDKTITNIRLTIPDEVGKLYAISQSGTVTASITPAPAAVVDTDKPTLITDRLTYNGGEQALLASDGTAAQGGNLMYSLDGKDYSYTIPTGTDAATYTVWYKVEASDDNHKDSVAVRLGNVTISANKDPVSVMCMPSTIQYNGTEQTPTVVVRDSAQGIIPESEYTVTLPTPRIAVGKYTVTVTDKTGGNYEFSGDVTGTFEIVSAAQNPLSIVTDIPTDVHYGDTFRLSAMGGSGSGAIQWNIAESSVATINTNGVVTVKGTGGFTVTAYRAAADGYSQSNTDSVPFEAKPKPVTPVVTVDDKPYDGTTTANLTALVRSSDKVKNSDVITLTVQGKFASPDAGTGKRVDLTGHAVDGTDAAKYTVNWPDSVTATINKVDAKLDTAPAAPANLTYTGSAQNLVTGGSTVGSIGKVEYATSQNGAYSETIPTGTNAGEYTVWYKVADSVNYTGVAPAAIEVEIKKATPNISTKPTASGAAGTKLSDIQLNGGATDVGGKFAWESPETEAQANTEYNVIFTPDDTANYNTVTITVIPVSVSRTSSAPMRTTVQNGAANTVLSAAGGNKLVSDAVANQSDSIVIKPEITGDVTKASVSIPASTASKINSQTDAALTVSAPIADVTIPNAALDTLGSAGGTVDVVTEQVDGAVKLTLSAGGETVESVPGGVTLTVPAEETTPGTVAMLVNEDGTRQVIQKSVAKDGAVSVPLDGSATVELVDNSKAFDDVSSEDWSADAVAFASAHELFNGTSETTFSPNGTMSRGMLTTVLYNLEGRPEQDLTTKDLESGYSDVNGDDWYAAGVSWASEHGIVSGYGNGQFGPDDSITREQFAVMLWKYAGSPEASDQTLSFADADQASSYAQEALCWAVEKGIMNGYNGRLSPSGTATRAEAAQMLKNFMENI